MTDNNILSILEERYCDYNGNQTFDDALKPFKCMTVKRNKAGQLYIHHADDCGEEVDIPYGIDFIKPGAFRKQYALKRVNVLADIIEIPRYTFVNCTSLSEISLPNSVLSIGENAFENCSSLERITIPASVERIKGEAFLGCKALKEVELLNPDTTIGKDVLPEGCVVKCGSEKNTGIVSELTVKEEEASAEVPEDLEGRNTANDNGSAAEKDLSVKMLFCADVRLGAICTENLAIKLSHKWQAARSEKLANLIDKAAQNHVAYVALFGRMFGQERMAESVIDGLFDVIKADRNIQVLALLNAEEYKRISYRNDIPENLHLLCTQASDSYTDDHVALRIEKGVTELRPADHDALTIRGNADGKYELCGLSEAYAIPLFEPTGFEDAEESTGGYGILEWSADSIGHYSTVPDQKYRFQSIELKVNPEDDEKAIVRKINDATRKVDYDTFLRITITGRSAFGLTISGDGLKNQLQSRVFFAEVYDNTAMDIDEEAFENDISLRSEFVRLALQDDSLSDSERNRLISCGWNALSGREVTAE